jgi:hypothetical protein
VERSVVQAVFLPVMPPPDVPGPKLNVREARRSVIRK